MELRGLLETLALERPAGPGETVLPTLPSADGGPVRISEISLGPRDSVVLVGQTLGEGGMGIVRLGTQVSLGRSVAVKSTRPERSNPQAVAKLVQEAWVTGFLEHTSIVPIYDLTEDQNGRPMLVMRRIEGLEWSELFGDADAIRERFGASDLLDWNLRVLMQLASALHFAHGRQILHLDLGPANVMIGPLGEVYLVDWGLAMALGGDKRLPRAADNTEIIGTPSYVAPEMLTGDGTQLRPQTDVYLLGSTLYTLLAGEPPHRGDTP